MQRCFGITILDSPRHLAGHHCQQSKAYKSNEAGDGPTLSKFFKNILADMKKQTRKSKGKQEPLDSTGQVPAEENSFEPELGFNMQPAQPGLTNVHVEEPTSSTTVYETSETLTTTSQHRSQKQEPLDLTGQVSAEENSSEPMCSLIKSFQTQTHTHTPVLTPHKIK